MTEIVKEDNSAKCAPMISLALVSTPVVMQRSKVYLLWSQPIIDKNLDLVILSCDAAIAGYLNQD